jgi:dipeptidyl aminopeptidase/acylaminoacyl peptidase
MDFDGKNKEQISSINDGINGFKYSPAQNRIIFTKDVKLDKTATDIHTDLPKADAKIIDDLMYRHWNDWHDYKYSHIFVADYNDGAVGGLIDIMEGEKFDSPMNPWGGLEQINWNNAGTKIAYTSKKLSGKDWATSTNSEIYIYDVASRKTINLTEKGFDGYDHDPLFSPDDRKLVWRSMKTPGFEADKDRIFVYDFQNETFTDYSEDFDQSSNHFEWSSDGEKIYFISGIHATYQIYSLDINSKEIKQITEGDHNYTSFVLAENSFVATKMTMKRPNEIFIVDQDGEAKEISFVNKEVFENIKSIEFEKRWIETTDGKKMLTWVIYPPNFDKTKKYPTLLYCQGGPQSAVSQFFSFRWNFQMMAANGYIVVAPNRRGLPTFGQAWNDQISGDYGGQNMKDYLSAIDTVAKEDFVDNDNLGAIGASYGGYSVYWLAGNHDGRFNAFISHCGIYHFESMYASTEEYFFVNHDYEGAYWEKPKPKSYKFSPHHFVGKWDAPIMVIHGGKDFRIPYTQSMQAFNAAQLQGIESRFLFFPEESHFVLKPQNSILWQREFKRFLDENLKN